MLIQFRAENFLSIKGSVVLSLLASKDKEHPKHLIVNGSKRYLKSAGIYEQAIRYGLQMSFCILVHGKLCADFA